MTITNELLTVNEYSRPGRHLVSVKGLVLHWVGNPRTSAKFNRDYFELRRDGSLGYGSAHYVIGLNGEIVQAIPNNEMAYHVGADQYTKYAIEKYGIYPNNCTIGIELCHIDTEGTMNAATWVSARKLCRSLCDEFNLNQFKDITTHMAIVGTAKKRCPLYFFNNPDEFQRFQMEV